MGIITNIWESIVGRHGRNEEESKAIIARAMTARSDFKEGDFGFDVSSLEGLQAKYPGAKILGVAGTPISTAPILSVTRWGNIGLHVKQGGTSGGYIQISLLPGAVANVSMVNHNAFTGEVMGGTMVPATNTNIKLYGNNFPDCDGWDVLFDSINGMEVAKVMVDGKPKPIYRPSEMTIFLQITEIKEQNGANGKSASMVASFIAIVDTQPEAVDALEKGGRKGFFTTEHVIVTPRNKTKATLEEVVNAALPEEKPEVKDSMNVLEGGDCPI